jgi:integrase
MPRKGDGISKTAGGKWRVDFRVKSTVRLADGSEVTSWAKKTRVFAALADAKAFKRTVDSTAAMGKVWRDERTVAVVTVGALCDAFTDNATNPRTKKTRRSYLRSFTEWAGIDRPVSDLSAPLLDAYAASLPGEGRAAATRHRKVLEIEAAWKWGRGRGAAEFPGLPEPVKVTSKASGGGTVQPAAPVVRLAAPSIEDVDRMRDALRPGWRYRELTARVALLLRYTGLRVSQAVGLRWSDVRVDQGTAGPWLFVRAGSRGAKASRGRVIPLHPALAAAMAEWGERSGLVFNPGPDAGPFWTDGEAVRDALTTAWEASGVDRGKWSVSDAERAAGDRAHGTPTHAIRAAVKVHLLRSGVSETLADYYVGHSRGATSRAYVPEEAPEASPYWPALVAAVAAIPAHCDPHATPNGTGSAAPTV